MTDILTDQNKTLGIVGRAAQVRTLNMFDLWYHNDSLLSNNKLIGEFGKASKTIHFERKKAVPHGPTVSFTY